MTLTSTETETLQRNKYIFAVLANHKTQRPDRWLKMTLAMSFTRFGHQKFFWSLLRWYSDPKIPIFGPVWAILSGTVFCRGGYQGHFEPSVRSVGPPMWQSINFELRNFLVQNGQKCHFWAFSAKVRGFSIQDGPQIGFFRLKIKMIYGPRWCISWRDET